MCGLCRFWHSTPQGYEAPRPSGRTGESPGLRPSPATPNGAMATNEHDCTITHATSAGWPTWDGTEGQALAHVTGARCTDSTFCNGDTWPRSCGARLPMLQRQRRQQWVCRRTRATASPGNSAPIECAHAIRVHYRQPTKPRTLRQKKKRPRPRWRSRPRSKARPAQARRALSFLNARPGPSRWRFARQDLPPRSPVPG